MGPSGSERYISPYGRQLIIKPIEIGRSQRTAGGTLKTDIINVKYQFELPYSMIDGTALNELLTLYNLQTALNLRIYTSPSSWFLNYDGNLPTVRVNAISRRRIILLGQGLWGDINIVLDET